MSEETTKSQTTVVEDVGTVPAEAFELQLGPSHPAMHGIVKLDTIAEGELVVGMNATIGYLHRGMEKMCEHRTWDQNVVFTDRLNYVSPTLNNAAYCAAIEKHMGITLPERAVWVRMIVSEMGRVADHLTCVTASAMELGGFTHFFYYIKARELIYFMFEKICGARVTTSMSRVGGQAFDLYDGFEKEWREDVEPQIRELIEDGSKLITRNRIFYDRFRHTGELPLDRCISYGMTGPRLRAAGSDLDLRKDAPYWFYDKLDFEVPSGKYGDNYDAYLIRMEEMEQSLRMIDQCLDKLPDGDVMLDDPKVFQPKKKDTYGHIEGLIHHFKHVMEGVKVPAGERYYAVEAPNGELGFYIVSDGSGIPFRVRVRPPCFMNTAALTEMCIGGQIADIVPTFGSINMIGGELER